MQHYWEAFVEAYGNTVTRLELVVILELFYNYCNDKEKFLKQIKKYTL